MTPTMNAALPARTTPGTAPTAPGTLDPLLQKVRDSIESSLPPDGKDAVDRIVVAGRKILYSPQTRGTVSKIYDQIQQGGFQPKQIAQGVNNLMVLIMNASHGNAPLPALYPAGAILLCYVLDDFSKIKWLQVSGSLVAQTEQIMRQLFMKIRIQPAQPSAGAETPAPTQPNATTSTGLLSTRG